MVALAEGSMKDGAQGQHLEVERRSKNNGPGISFIGPIIRPLFFNTLEVFSLSVHPRRRTRLWPWIRPPLSNTGRGDKASC